MEPDKNSTLRELGEDALVRRVTASLAQGSDVIVGAGDDCAVVKPGGEHLQLLKTDSILETVHFRPEDSPEEVGWKAAARNVSDIAAMGGRPDHALVTLIVPGDRAVAWVDGIYAGLNRCSEQFGFSIVGGETSRAPEDYPLALISISLTGTVKPAHLLLRSGANAGDEILVTGRLGGSFQSGRHLTFSPRLEESAFLAASGMVSAMMDLSDGLGQDLPRLARASGCGYRVDEEKLPLHEGVTIPQAISDGEDYQLLLTVPADKVSHLQDAWASNFPETPLTSIGEMVSVQNTVSLAAGWDHFSD